MLVRDAVNDLLSMYVDGVLVTSSTDNSGDIDNVRIFPLTLTEDDVATIA